jgi:hypothetical protein
VFAETFMTDFISQHRKFLYTAIILNDDKLQAKFTFFIAFFHTIRSADVSAAKREHIRFKFSLISAPK